MKPGWDLHAATLPLVNVALAVRTEGQPRAAYLAPGRTPLVVSVEGPYARVTVPRVEGHATVVLER